MKTVVFYALMILVMPYLTMLVAEHSIGGIASFVALAGAMLCIAVGAALAQVASIAVGIVRLVRKLLGRGRALDAPPSLAEKVFLVAGPCGFAVVVYATVGVILSFWADSGAAMFIAMMVGLGVLYGCLMGWGLLSNAFDPHDADALGAYPDAPADPATSPKRQAPEHPRTPTP